MAKRYAFRDDQWSCVKDLLPSCQENVGVTAKDKLFFLKMPFIIAVALGPHSEIYRSALVISA